MSSTTASTSIHPPFWWWAWVHGLDAYGRPLEPVYATMLLWAIVGGYVVQRVIEGIFMRRFGGMHIHVWRPIDSQFRLITARRNPNMVILVAALLFGRPDVGLELVALWTDRQPDLPRRPAGPGDNAAARARRADRLLAGVTGCDGACARRVAARRRSVRASSWHRPQGADPGRAASRWCGARSRAAGERRQSAAVRVLDAAARADRARCCPTTRG